MLPPLFAIFAWPAIGATFFGKVRKPLAILLTILAGFLLLPELTAIDLPLLPSFDKYTIPALTALFLSLLLAPKPGEAPGLPGMWSRLASGRILFAGLIAGSFATVWANGDGLVYGARYLPGLRPYDAFSIVLSLLMLLLPAVLARKYLASPEAHRLILVTLCVLALGYSLLALLEIRLSPQMNRWTYGFFPHSWAQHRRGDGFRPLVFLSHGLVLAMFFCMSIVAAIGLSRADPSRRSKYLMAAAWLMMTLALSRSLGALLIAIPMALIALFLSVRTQLMLAAAVAAIFLTYPVLRGAHLIPIESILEIATDISAERASSLEYRIVNEEQLLEKARQRPLFGWGGYARGRVFDESGQDISVTDGYWIIVIGGGGWARYVFEFGLLAMPIFLLLWRSRGQPVGRETSTLALILAANLIDLLPNASVTPITWLVAGALWGRLEYVPDAAAAQTARAPTAAQGRARSPAYARLREAEAPDPVAAARPASEPAPRPAYTRQTARIVRPAQPVRR